MSNEKIFSAHEHLNALLEATAGAFESTESTSDLVVGGILRAVQSRLNHLNDLIKLRGEATDSEYMCILLNGRVQELAVDVQTLHDTIDEMEAKLTFIKRIYGIEVKNI